MRLSTSICISKSQSPSLIHSRNQSQDRICMTARYTSRNRFKVNSKPLVGKFQRTGTPLCNLIPPQKNINSVSNSPKRTPFKFKQEENKQIADEINEKYKFDGFQNQKKLQLFYYDNNEEDMALKLSQWNITENAIEIRNSQHFANQLEIPRRANESCIKLFVKKHLGRSSLLTTISSLRKLNIPKEDFANLKIASSQPFQRPNSKEFIKACRIGDIKKVEYMLFNDQMLVLDFDRFGLTGLH